MIRWGRVCFCCPPPPPPHPPPHPHTHTHTHHLSALLPAPLPGFTPCRYAYPVTCTGFTTDPSTGRVTEVQATYEPDLTAKKPPKGVLNWVGQPAPGRTPPTFEARLYDVLFKSQNPSSQVNAALRRGGVGRRRGCQQLRAGGCAVQSKAARQGRLYTWSHP
jgi:hypothetical protein